MDGEFTARKIAAELAKLDIHGIIRRVERQAKPSRVRSFDPDDILDADLPPDKREKIRAERQRQDLWRLSREQESQAKAALSKALRGY